MDKEGKKGVNQGFSIVKALLSSKTVSDKRDICAIMTVSSVYKHVTTHKMKINSIIFIIIFCPLFVLGQVELTKEQVSEDYTILKNVLTKGYPSLYEYTSQSKWDSLFKNFEKEKLTTIKTTNYFYKSIIELTDYTKDGHLIVMRPQLSSIPKLFPLLLKIIDYNI